MSIVTANITIIRFAIRSPIACSFRLSRKLRVLGLWLPGCGFRLSRKLHLLLKPEATAVNGRC